MVITDLSMDFPVGDLKTGETPAVSDLGFVIQSTDVDDDYVCREFNGNRGGFFAWAADNGYVFSVGGPTGYTIEGEGIPAGTPAIGYAP